MSASLSPMTVILNEADLSIVASAKAEGSLLSLMPIPRLIRTLPRRHASVSARAQTGGNQSQRSFDFVQDDGSEDGVEASQSETPVSPFRISEN